MKGNIIPHLHSISFAKRLEKIAYLPKVFWFTGLSGSGKSTLSNILESHFFECDYRSYLLDGDNIRSGLNKDLSFDETDRKENIRRIGEVAKLFINSGSLVLTAFISPFREDRAFVKNLVGAANFVEIFVKCSLEECERRDVKGLYKKARAGEIPFFTGISSPFEEPESPDLIIDTESNSLDDCGNRLIEETKKIISKS